MAGINRIPRGYLDFVGAETLGRNPTETSDVVSPVIELSPLYTAQTMAQSFVSLNSAPPNAAIHIVPDGEVWLVYGVGALMGVATLAGDGLSLAIAVTRLPRGTQNAITWIAGAGPQTIQVNGDGIMLSHAFPVPIPLNGGSTIRLQSIAVIGNARTVDTYVLYSSLRG